MSALQKLEAVNNFMSNPVHYRRYLQVIFGSLLLFVILVGPCMGATPWKEVPADLLVAGSSFAMFYFLRKKSGL